MGKKGRRKSSRRSTSSVKVPPALVNTAVPTLFGFGLGAALTQNVALGILFAVAFGAMGYFFLNKRTEVVQAAAPEKKPEDVLRHALAHTSFIQVETYDERRPEAISVDGKRWSQIMKFTDLEGESDVYMVRGSLMTGESKLEYIEGTSRHFPSYWAMEPPLDWDKVPEENEEEGTQFTLLDWDSVEPFPIPRFQWDYEYLLPAQE